jgi:hypothetical protein
LKYATNSIGVWVSANLDSTGDIGQFTSIAVDSNNKIHIIYYDSTNEDLKYGTNESGIWTYTTIDSTVGIGHFNSIGIDSNNKVHISYFDKQMVV